MSFEFGIGSAGLGVTFPHTDGAAYGIIGPGSDLSSANLNNKLPLVESTTSSPSSAEFVISNFNTDVSNITDLYFGFGTAGGNNVFASMSTNVPEPGGIVLMAIGAMGLAMLALLKRRLREKRHAI